MIRRELQPRIDLSPEVVVVRRRAQPPTSYPFIVPDVPNGLNRASGGWCGRAGERGGRAWPTLPPACRSPCDGRSSTAESLCVGSGAEEVVWDDGEGEFDVDEGDAEEEDGEGDGGGEGGEEGDGDGKEEEEGQDQSVPGTEKCHVLGRWRKHSILQCRSWEDVDGNRREASMACGIAGFHSRPEASISDVNNLETQLQHHFHNRYSCTYGALLSIILISIPSLPKYRAM